MFFSHPAAILLGTLLAAPCALADAPRVWVFTGIPGDTEHHADFEKCLGSMTRAFTERLGVPRDHLTVYYGPQSAGYAGVANRENLLAAFQEITALSRTSPGTAHWLIFIGHAHGIRGGSQLNLPGPDLNSIDLAAALADCNPDAPLTFIFTHTASAPFLRPLALPGRVVLTATAPNGIENETEFPIALAEALNDPASDADKNSRLDAGEIFQATRERVLQRYKTEDLIVRETALLDGDGDGRGTRRPAETDATGAAKHSFTITTAGQAFE